MKSMKDLVNRIDGLEHGEELDKKTRDMYNAIRKDLISLINLINSKGENEGRLKLKDMMVLIGEIFDKKKKVKNLILQQVVKILQI